MLHQSGIPPKNGGIAAHSRCFESNGFGELDCNQTTNTAFGALSAALLF